MDKITPKIMPGFMELLPEDQILFNEMIDTIRKTYESFGFLPIDTPLLEYSSILLAKAKGETEKQIYRFKKGENDISLRFDLTVPFARYVSKNYYNLAFPFKRYQIGKVYRGERPQKGRYREFYQCDIDVIDENLSLNYDVEVPSIIYEIFKKLNFGKFTIKINNRKILLGFFNELSISDKTSDILRIIDKLEKIGKEKIIEELRKINIDNEKIEEILNFITITGTNEEIISKLKKLNIENENFNSGVNELEYVISNIGKFNSDNTFYKIDLTIARGLDYYTGTVYETVLDDYPELGSICSGGRYDNLTKYYLDENLSGIGISIGITRLFYKLKEAGIINSKVKTLTKVLVVPFSIENIPYSLKVAKILRENEINTDTFLEDKSFKSKLKYANRAKIPYVCIIGENEEKQNEVTIKNMETGEQTTKSIEKIVEDLKRD